MDESRYKSPWIIEPDLCEKGDIDVLHKHGERRRFPRGAYVYRQGDARSEHIYFLVSGRIRIVSVSPQGEERVLSLLEPGVFFGEAAFFDQSGRFASAEAVVPSEVLRFNRETAMVFLKDHPVHQDSLLRSMSQKIRLLSIQVEDLTFWPIEKRLCRLLLKFISDFGIKSGTGVMLSIIITDEQLGQLIGARREAVTKALSKMRKQGLLIKEKRRLYFHSLDLFNNFI